MRRCAWLIALFVLACERREPPSPRADDAATPPPPPGSASAGPRASAPSAPEPQPEPEPAAAKPHALLSRPPATWAVMNAAWRGPVDPEADRAWLQRLAASPIVEISNNAGGATLTLRVRFADAQRGVFKPEQTHSASNYRSEIVAYHLDRVLGLGRVAPVVGRELDAARLRVWLANSKSEGVVERFDREVVVENGRVRGAVIGWHTARLSSAEPPRGWAAALFEPDAGFPTERALEWSDMVLFDYLIDNTDRWSGGNVLSLGKDGKLIFLDNAAGLMRTGIAPPAERPLGGVCRFRAATIASLQSAAPRLAARLAKSLGPDPLAPVLSERQLAAIERRATLALEHVERCVATHGRERALAAGDG